MRPESVICFVLFWIITSAALRLTCAPDEFTCDDGFCIPRIALFDSFPDCPNWEDEKRKPTIRFDPPPTSYKMTESENMTTITCRANFEKCSFTWTHVGHDWNISGSDLNLGRVSRFQNGVFRCTVKRSDLVTAHSDLVLNVQFPPSSVTLSGDTNILANGINKITLTCTTSTANPVASLIWMKNGKQITNTRTPIVTDGDNEGKIVSQILELAPTRDDEGARYMCVTTNDVNALTLVRSGEKILNLTYIPIITTSISTLDVTECTRHLILACRVASKPISTITWLREQTSLPSFGDNNFNIYSISNVNRTATGQYTCRANNGYWGIIQETVNVTVKYRPDVFVTKRNRTNSSVDIVCHPSGVPDKYTFSSWTHRWNISGPVLDHPGLGEGRILTLSNLTYEYSGVYTCHVNNGVDCSKNKNAGHGHVRLEVKAAPIVTDPPPSSSFKRMHVASQMKSRAIVNITFWSYPDNVVVRCYRVKDNKRMWMDSSHVIDIVKTPTIVRLPVFTGSVSTSGTLVTLSILIDKTDDFGDYEIVLSNGIGGNRKVEIIVVPQGPPQTPTLDAVKVLSSSSVSVNWTRGFHGGLDQTIVMQISTDQIIWQNKSIPDGQNNENTKVSTEITGLTPSTSYYLRMLAYNRKGRSDNYTKIYRFTTHAVTTADSLIGAYAGGAGGVAAVFIIISVVCVQMRRRNLTARKPSTRNVAASQPLPCNEAAVQPSPGNVTAVQPSPGNVTAVQPSPGNVTAVYPSSGNVIAVQLPGTMTAVQQSPGIVTAVQPSPGIVTAVQPSPGNVTAVQPSPGNVTAVQQSQGIVTTKQSLQGNVATEQSSSVAPYSYSAGEVDSGRPPRPPYSYSAGEVDSGRPKGSAYLRLPASYRDSLTFEMSHLDSQKS